MEGVAIVESLLDFEAAGQLILASENETLPGAVTVALGAARRNPGGVAAFLESAIVEGPYPSVVVGDLTGWSNALRTAPAKLLARLAHAVQPGGSLFAGFGNRHYPGGPFAAGTLSLKRACAVLDRVGFTVAKQYVAMPDQRCPALLVPVSASEAELACVPPALRFQFAPAYAVVGLRPSAEPYAER
ncbi:hypothetical protein [Catenulispora subtropica]|uniref:Uncharacterized protein n=1 Tax=Catenulispora subtropica TaxID=450798 RepID=A0ABN2QGQ9_9ACTN